MARDTEFSRSTSTGTPITTSGTSTIGSSTRMASGMPGTRFFLRYFLYVSLTSFGESFVSRPFFQPPSILPTSLISSESLVYCLVSMSWFSQPIWRKNLRRSSLLMAATRYCNLVSILAYWARNRISSISRKRVSILLPNVYR